MASQTQNLKIFLIGLPGCGKTTLAKQMAEQSGLAFLDLDEEIEKSNAKKVEEIFLERGEKYFRELERKELIKCCGLNSGFIMATGGGAPCYENNIEMMKAAGDVIFLDVTAKEICQRILKQTINRPLLKHETPDSLKDRIEFLRSHRISFYRQAHHILSVNQITAMGIMDLIESRDRPERAP